MSATAAPTRSFATSSLGVRCALWTYAPPTSPSRGLLVFFHGLGGHGRFPSVSVGAEALAANGFTVVCPDLPGHGESDGLRGFLYSAPTLEDDGVAFVHAAREAHPTLPLFLIGSSMGAALALRVSLRFINVSGLALLAPMLASEASAPARALLSVLSYTPLCRLALIPSSATNNEVQYADPTIASQIESDELAYRGGLRIGSASSVVDLGARCELSLRFVRCPFLVMLAEREQVLGPAAAVAAEALATDAATPQPDRNLKRYDALHGLLCEIEPTRTRIIEDLVSFFRAHSD